MKRKQITAMITAMTMVLGITACGAGNVSAEQENKEQTEIESTLNISNNDEITWSYDSQSDSWTMSVTCAVANPELPDYQGVSVNVPGAYVKGIDTNGDGKEDITGKTYSEEVNGRLVIDDSAKIANTNGQTYTAWKRCLNGQRMPMIYVLYPYVILMHVEHIQMERLGKLTIRKHT